MAVFANPLRLPKILLGKKGIEKNLLAKKFLESIEYCKNSIKLNLFSSSGIPAKAGPQKEKISAEGGENSEITVRKGRNGCPAGVKSNHIISIILPNTIHQCKKKNI